MTKTKGQFRPATRPTVRRSYWFRRGIADAARGILNPPSDSTIAAYQAGYDAQLLAFVQGGAR